MSYSCADFYSDVMAEAERLLTPAERRRLEQAGDPAPGTEALLRILRTIPTPKPVKRSLHQFHPDDPEDVVIGLAMLRQALALFKSVGAVRTVERVRLAISSAKGAVRNVGYRRGRETNRKRMEEGTL